MKIGASLLRDSVVTGVIATTATTAAITWRGMAEKGKAVPPLNAVSHIAWGSRAAHRDKTSWKFTATGLILNSMAVTLWGALYEAFLGERGEKNPLVGLLGGAAISAAAYITDYYLVPKRFTPGFEMRLRQRSLTWIYAILGLSLPLRGLLQRGL
jgi:hypothetical protein